MPASTRTPGYNTNPPFNGGCACGAVRFRMQERPMYVRCCHCTRCQRETGSPFAHHAMIEFSKFSVVQGEPEYVLVPTDSGGEHWVARCPACRTAMCNEHGTRKAITRYVRVGTLDDPAACPPQAHIYVKYKQPWVIVPADAPAFQGYYDAAKTWPAESLARYDEANKARAADTMSTHSAATSRG